MKYTNYNINVHEIKEKELQKTEQAINKVKERYFKRKEDFRFCDSYWVKFFEYPIKSTN